MARLCAPNEAMEVASESANTGRRRRSTGSSGAGSLSCRQTSATPLAAPTAISISANEGTPP